jgi:hypothetical protein
LLSRRLRNLREIWLVLKPQSLVGAEEAEAMAGKTWDFRPSLMTNKMILQLEKDGYIPQGRAKLSQGETVPMPSKDYAIVFKDYFFYGLRLPSV